MNWYNFIRPHGALDLANSEPPVKAYYARLLRKEVLTDPSLLELGVK